MDNIILNSLEQSLLFLPFILGLYISFIVLKLTDITVEASFVIGASIIARLLTEGYHFSIAIIVASIGGMISGIAVSCLQYRNRINDLIAGILMVYMLYSVNLNILGKPNINLFDSNTIVSSLSLFVNNPTMISALLIAIIVTLFIYYLLISSYGLKLRALGENPALLQKLGVNSEKYRTIGLVIANSLAALSGSISAQIYGYADVNMGFGMAITGIGALIIGQQITLRIISFTPLKDKYHPVIELLSCILGAYLYFLVINILLKININPTNLKLFTGMIIVLLLISFRRKNTNI